LNGYFPRCWLWFVCETNKHMYVVTEKSPVSEIVVFNVHIALPAIIVAVLIT